MPPITHVLVLLAAGGLTLFALRTVAPRLAGLLVAAARANADEGGTARALRLLAVARWLDRGPVAALEQALLLERLGEIEGAVRAYDAASRRSKDGWADFQAALLLVRSKREEDAEGRLERAFSRSPFLAEEAPCFPEFRALLRRRRFKRFRQGP